MFLTALLATPSLVEPVSLEKHERSETYVSSSLVPPPEIVAALTAFARHDAAAQRHLRLLERLRAARAEAAILRESQDELRTHMNGAAAEMRGLRQAIEIYTRLLRDSGLPPERALVVVRSAIKSMVASLPPLDRPRDPAHLASEVVQCAIEAYYAA